MDTSAAWVACVAGAGRIGTSVGAAAVAGVALMTAVAVRVTRVAWLIPAFVVGCVPRRDIAVPAATPIPGTAHAEDGRRVVPAAAAADLRATRTVFSPLSPLGFLDCP
ncbi:hypothetical protein KDL01_19020 [Actinospica durhamensis]|uniref:Uncharacterized protein n=1 Tax=Actinospica durhamensis TaxID=1508375 RepID=A0A941EUN5_9ACTN|nr:hypothetical protein [Actinospica durhamensis]MBR7835374.1 hypothetical protein [Actinospica durhamensis]